MITDSIWHDFKFKLQVKGYKGYCYKNDEIARLLIGTILGTPFAVALDIVFAPIEIIYIICLKVVRKLRG